MSVHVLSTLLHFKFIILHFTFYISKKVSTTFQRNLNMPKFSYNQKSKILPGLRIFLGSSARFNVFINSSSAGVREWCK